ncbi:sensor histidine kinase [Desertivirga arenae]|uniref:sensor histidine kinase n=1 Tax=Desertivirga arenae TaxID=2810309 RepID=UPI001A9653F0|nr:PAS domain-containing sensor histidine kinase [Pedobacter sp. SYSU D00823]
MTNKQSFKLIADSPVATFVLDVSTESLVYINSAFKNLFNLGDDLNSVTNFSSYFTEEDKSYLREVYSALLQGIEKSKVDVRFNPLTGPTKWLRLQPWVIDGDSGKQVVATVTPITEERNNYSSKDKYANKKNAVLNILAHDLAGPLAIANTLASSLRNKIDGALYHQIEAIGKIIAQSHNLIKDLTNREFLETAEVQLVKNRIDIVKKLKEYFEEYQQSEQLTNRTFILNSSAPSILIEVDEAKFIQIVNNLTTNALKFTHEEALISINIEDKGEKIMFTYSDNGIGIPDEFKEVLFEQFTPARRKGLQGEPSTGMGMWVVKTIVEWHKGNIWFDSKENEGTSFFIELPKH